MEIKKAKAEVTTQSTPLTQPVRGRQILERLWDKVPTTWKAWGWSCLLMWLGSLVFFALVTLWSQRIVDLWDLRDAPLWVGCLWLIYSGPLVVLVKIAQTRSGRQSSIAWMFVLLSYPFMGFFAMVGMLMMVLFDLAIGWELH